MLVTICMIVRLIPEAKFGGETLMSQGTTSQSILDIIYFNNIPSLVFKLPNKCEPPSLYRF